MALCIRLVGRRVSLIKIKKSNCERCSLRQLRSFYQSPSITSYTRKRTTPTEPFRRLFEAFLTQTSGCSINRAHASCSPFKLKRRLIQRPLKRETRRIPEYLNYPSCPYPRLLNSISSREKGNETTRCNLPFRSGLRSSSICPSRSDIELDFRYTLRKPFSSAKGTNGSLGWRYDEIYLSRPERSAFTAHGSTSNERNGT